jgi:hypothetical protein
LLYIATEYPTNGSVTFPNWDGTNEDEIIDSMASYTFENVGYFTDISYYWERKNKRKWCMWTWRDFKFSWSNPYTYCYYPRNWKHWSFR